MHSMPSMPHGLGDSHMSPSSHGPMGDPSHTHHWSTDEHGSIFDKGGGHVGSLKGDMVVDKHSGHHLTIGEHGALYHGGNKVGSVKHEGSVYKVLDKDGHHVATVAAHHGEGPAKYATSALALLRHIHGK